MISFYRNRIRRLPRFYAPDDYKHDDPQKVEPGARKEDRSQDLVSAAEPVGSGKIEVLVHVEAGIRAIYGRGSRIQFVTVMLYSPDNVSEIFP
jgi:hypothetical protein